MARYIIEVRMEPTGIWVCATPDDRTPAIHDTREQAIRCAKENYRLQWERAQVRVRADPGQSYRAERWAIYYRTQGALDGQDQRRVNATVDAALKEMRDAEHWAAFRKLQAENKERAKAARAGMN